MIVHKEKTTPSVRTREEYGMRGPLAARHSRVRDDEETPTTYKVDEHSSSKCHEKIEDLKSCRDIMPKRLSALLTCLQAAVDDHLSINFNDSNAIQDKVKRTAGEI